jgi:hypothetical protein
MRQEARLVHNELFKGEWSTELDFAILADEWPAHRDRFANGPATPRYGRLGHRSAGGALNVQ